MPKLQGFLAFRQGAEVKSHSRGREFKSPPLHSTCPHFRRPKPEFGTLPKIRQSICCAPQPPTDCRHFTWQGVVPWTPWGSPRSLARRPLRDGSIRQTFPGSQCTPFAHGRCALQQGRFLVDFYIGAGYVRLLAILTSAGRGSPTRWARVSDPAQTADRLSPLCQYRRAHRRDRTHSHHIETSRPEIRWKKGAHPTPPVLQRPAQYRRATPSKKPVRQYSPRLVPVRTYAFAWLGAPSPPVSHRPAQYRRATPSKNQ
jgi:hypothetical protein